MTAAPSNVAQLGSLCELITKGSSPNWQGFEYSPTGIPFVRSQNVGWGSLDITDVAYLPPSFNLKEKKSILRTGDVLLNIVGASIGRACVATDAVEGGNVNQAVAVIRVRREALSSSYLKWFLISPPAQARIHSEKVDVARANLSLEGIRCLSIRVPPLTEQRRIVAEIEKQFTRLDAGIAALRRTQANLKRYRAAVLKAACEGRLVPTAVKTWKQGTLRDVLVRIEAGKSFKCDERPPTKSEIGVVKVSAVTWGIYDELESKTCQDADRVEERYVVKPGDFLFSRANTIQLIGKCVIAQKVTLRVMLSDKILRFHFSPAVIPRWILYWLRSDFGRHEIERLSTGNQESMRNIGQERIRQIMVRLPPLAEQTRIVAEVERRLSVVEELETVVNANVQRASRLRQSILQRVFSGKP